MIEKRLQTEKVLQTFTGATFFPICNGGRGPDGGGLKEPIHAKVTQNYHLEGTLLRTVFQTCASGCSGEHMFVKLRRQNASELKFHQKAVLQIAFLMQLRIKMHR